jgi:DNA-binding FrmR family transcriptional regulator
MLPTECHSVDVLTVCAEGSLAGGALDALMAEVIEGHIRSHVLDPRTTPTDEQSQAADYLVHALRAYLK